VELDRHNTIMPTTPTANIQLHTAVAKIPTRCSVMSIGYNVYSTITVTLQPHLVTKIPLDITIVPPPGTYIQIHPRSGLATKGITIYAGVIDPDYRGPISVLMCNSIDQKYQVHSGDRIAQLIFQNVTTPVLLQQDTLDTTERAENVFGSTGNMEDPPVCRTLHPTDMPYNIFLCTDPFSNKNHNKGFWYP
jgi:dUTP pyrophosphatase